MTAPACSHFPSCSAPLCPLDPAGWEGGQWFCDEEICHRLSLPNFPPWVGVQKFLRRLTRGAFETGYFTVRMLSVLRFPRKGIRGLDPDRPGDTEEKWIRRLLRGRKGWRQVAKGAEKQGVGCATGGERSESGAPALRPGIPAQGG